MISFSRHKSMRYFWNIQGGDLTTRALDLDTSMAIRFFSVRAAASAAFLSRVRC